MNREAEFDQLVGLIYEAAVDEDYWESVLLEISDFFNAAGTALWVHDFETSRVLAATSGQSILSVRFDPAFVKSYADYYSLTNVWVKQEELMRENSVVSSSMLFDDKLLPGTEYYGDWLKPQNLFYSIGTIAAKSGSLAVKLKKGVRLHYYATDLLRLLPLCSASSLQLAGCPVTYCEKVTPFIAFYLRTANAASSLYRGNMNKGVRLSLNYYR